MIAALNKVKVWGYNYRKKVHHIWMVKIVAAIANYTSVSSDQAAC